MHLDTRSWDKCGTEGDAATAHVNAHNVAKRLGPGCQIPAADLRDWHRDAIADDQQTIVGSETVEFVRIREESGGPNRTWDVEFRSQPCLVTFPSQA